MRRYATISPWLFTLSLSALLWAPGCTGPASDGGDGSEMPPVAVTVVVVQPVTLQPTLDGIGTLIAPPEKTAMLSPQVGGYVSGVPVVEGAQVHAGDPIVQLDTRLVQSELNKATAAADEARANLALLKKGPLPAEVEAGRQDVRNAAATAEARRGKLKALEELQKHGEISDVQYGQAQSTAAEAEAARLAAAERFKLLQSGSRPEAVAQGEAQLKLAESERDMWALKVALCTITAPIEGTVTQLPVRQGMSVDPQTNVATIQDLSTLYGRVRVPAAQLIHLTVGADAQVTLDGARASVHEGTVQRIGAEAGATTGDVEVLVALSNEGGAFRPGLGCRVHLALAPIPDALAVPPAAITDRNGQAVVTIVEGGKAFQRDVQTGVQTTDAIQVIDGVSPGDTIVTRGGYALPDGCPVEIVTE